MRVREPELASDRLISPQGGDTSPPPGRLETAKSSMTTGLNRVGLVAA
jgi:hypothetical protein